MLGVDESLLLPDEPLGRPAERPTVPAARNRYMKYSVKETDTSGWSSDEEVRRAPGSPVLTDDICTACPSDDTQQALWSCKACDMKYCKACWEANHPADSTHTKKPFKFRDIDRVSGETKGRLQFSGQSLQDYCGTAVEASTADSALLDFISQMHP